MPTSLLVAYATRYQSTQEVAAAVAEDLRQAGLTVELRLLHDVRALDGYQAIVIGAPLFMFRWHKDAHRFLARFRQEISDRPTAVFALGPVHDPHDEEEWQNSWSQLEKALAKYPWFHPVTLELFGGKYDPEKLRFPIKALAGDAPATDIRDWPAIHAWANEVAAKLDPVAG